MTRKIMRCEICWEDSDVYTEAILIGLIGHGYSEAAVCEDHVPAMLWHVPYVEYDD